MADMATSSLRGFAAMLQDELGVVVTAAAVRPAVADRDRIDAGEVPRRFLEFLTSDHAAPLKPLT